MTEKLIKDLFANDISRKIEEVIKVDQDDEKVIRDELAEYVVTDSIRGHLTEVLEDYWETPKKPHEGVAVWVSGFFGSGKSSFAKYLGLGLENRRIDGESAGQLLAQRAGDQKVEVLLKNISEQVPTHAVIFDVSTDRGIRTGNQSITEIMYRLFLQSLGYAKDLDLSELEITLEETGRLDDFRAKYQEVFGKNWDDGKGLIAIAVQQASRVMHELEPDTYSTPDSWRESAMKRADVTPGDLAKRGMELMQRRNPGKTLLFVVDEVGQFVARDVQKMLDLQAVVQNLGRIGRGKMWVVVTSQEKLTELVGGLDDKRVELARLMDRFPLQVHLAPADISEVTSKRVLSKNADAEKTLRELFNEHRGRLTDHTKLSADIKLPELSTEQFIDLYPLLPYQIDLIIQVVSGLRTQGGASKHVGGANRTIIKLAQQLLIHPDVDIASKPLGTLVRVDQVYDLVAGNIASEVRGKIDDIGKKVDHPLAQAVAKTICLLQYVRSIHRTPENIAAALHSAVDADSRLSEVKEALRALEDAHMVRHGDDGYRIPTPAEDDWERLRASLTPKPGDINRLHSEIVTDLWKPQPEHNFLDVKRFWAGLYLGGYKSVDGDIPVYLALAESGKEFDEQAADFRRRSQSEDKSIFWIAALDERIDRETVELYRSREILSRKERGAQTKDETALVAEEKRRQRKHQDELRRLIKQSLLTGSVYFRGNDRSPDESATEVNRAAGKVLGQALPEVFDRFSEAAAKVGKNDLKDLMTMDNLRGLPAIFSDLGLVRDQGSTPVFDTESGPLAEVLSWIENRTSYGERPTGAYLSDHFGKEPFGWDFDVLRLFVVCLLRAGKIEASSKGQLIDSATSVDARNTFDRNNLFRSASFGPRTTDTDMDDWIDAASAFQEVFGKQMPDISSSAPVVTSIRTELDKAEVGVEDAYDILRDHQLPGVDVLKTALDHMRSVRGGTADHAIKTFNGAHKEIKEAIKRSGELTHALNEARLQDLGRARRALETLWPFLSTEPDLADDLRDRATKLSDAMKKETFFRDLADIDQHTRVLEQEYKERYENALATRATAYEAALEKLHATHGWEQLNEDQRHEIEAPLASRIKTEARDDLSIPLLRSHTDACSSLLDNAVEKLMRIIDGNRIERVGAASYFSGGVETEEQLEQALDGLRQRCIELIGAGKKVLVQ